MDREHGLTYDTIGTSYRRTRQADPRVTGAVLEALSLPAAARLVDIGAGTGNYASALTVAGMKVIAVEPSRVMRDQRTHQPQVHWLAGRAEALPLAASSTDGALCILAIHHFTNLAAAFMEMCRVVHQGPIVLLTFDPRQSAAFWFADYFPSIWQASYQSFPPIDTIGAMLAAQSNRKVSIRPFLLPPDMIDLVAAAGWRQPQLYLDATTRAGMSPFVLADPRAVREGVTALERDLTSGAWHQSNTALLEQEVFDAGYRLVIAAHEPAPI
jgi:ubiquinone/menaquinone biosynthesis C-methylase UbiE